MHTRAAVAAVLAAALAAVLARDAAASTPTAVPTLMPSQGIPASSPTVPGCVVSIAGGSCAQCPCTPNMWCTLDQTCAPLASLGQPCTRFFDSCVPGTYCEYWSGTCFCASNAVCPTGTACNATAGACNAAPVPLAPKHKKHG